MHLNPRPPPPCPRSSPFSVFLGALSTAGDEQFHFLHGVAVALTVRAAREPSLSADFFFPSRKRASLRAAAAAAAADDAPAIEDATATAADVAMGGVAPPTPVRSSPSTGTAVGTPTRSGSGAEDDDISRCVFVPRAFAGRAP